MKEKTQKILTLALLGAAIVISIFAFIFALDTNNSGMFNIAYWLLVIMLGFSVAAIVVFLCKKLGARFKDEPGYLKKFLLLVGLIVVVLLASYLPASGTDIDLAKYGMTEGTSKLIGAACILCYIIVIAAAVAIVYAEVSPKKNNKKK